jgi:hypothetical protein
MLKFIDNLSFVFNCFCTGKDKTKKKNVNQKSTNHVDTDDIFNKQIYGLGWKENVVILPVRRSFDLDNLYPKTDQVHTWTTLIVGRDKTYVLANLHNVDEREEPTPSLLNRKGDGILSDSFREFLDPIWDKTLAGKQLQFFMTYNSQTYLVNTYPIHNFSKQVIGGIFFMRLFDTLLSSILKPERTSHESRDSRDGNHGASTSHQTN